MSVRYCSLCLACGFVSGLCLCVPPVPARGMCPSCASARVRACCVHVACACLGTQRMLFVVCVCVWVGVWVRERECVRAACACVRAWVWVCGVWMCVDVGAGGDSGLRRDQGGRGRRLLRPARGIHVNTFLISWCESGESSQSGLRASGLGVRGKAPVIAV